MLILRSINRFVLVSLTLLGMSVSSANAAQITELLGVDINGTSYDVTFHLGSSFNDLWDADDDGIFGESDSSLFNSAPTFWGDAPLALLAANAIISRLGTADTTTVVGSDSFLVAYGISNGILTSYFDGFVEPDNDVVGTAPNFIGAAITAFYPYVSFSPAASPVPIPAAVWLFGSALIGLLGFRNRNSRIAANRAN